MEGAEIHHLEVHHHRSQVILLQNQIVDKMDITNFQQLINELPNILMYICPGYITLWIHNSIIARNLKQSNYLIVEAVVISYLYILVANKICSLFVPLNKEVVTFIISIICGLSLRKIIVSKIFVKLTDSLGIESTSHNDIIDRIRDENGTWLRVYLDDQLVMYEGYLRYDRMDLEDERVIALSGYVKFKILDKVKLVEETNIPTELEIIEDYTGDNSKWIALKYELITRLEVIYNRER